MHYVKKYKQDSVEIGPFPPIPQSANTPTVQIVLVQLQCTVPYTGTCTRTVPSILLGTPYRYQY